jgi:hypothetical protein
MGESIFEQWTNQVGIVPNKVQQDETGWDFFIEFPQERAVQPLTLPLDKAVPPLGCLVQVKSTDKRKGCWAVKLSNWWRLVNNPVPAFFLVLEFDAQPNPQRAFLVYIHEQYMRRVLQRLREIPPGEQPTLHKRTLQFTYDATHALATLDGEGLWRAIRQHAGDNPLTYAEQKLHMLKRVGYEDGHGKLHFDIMVPKDQIRNVYDYLVDFALGLIPSVPIQKCTYWDARFGILEPEPSHSVEGTGELRITERKAIGEYDLRFRTQDGHEEFRIKTQAYLPQGLSHLVDAQYLKVRCAAPYLDFIFWMQQPQCDIRFCFPPLEEAHKLSALVPAARFLLFTQKALSQGGEVLLTLSTQGQRVLEGRLTIPVALNTYTCQVAEAILQAWTICKYFDLHEEIETCIAELMRQRERLCVLACALGPLPDVSLTSWVKPAIEDTTKAVCFPYVTGVIIGEYQMVFALALLGMPIPSGRTNEHGTEYEVKIHKISIYRQHIYGRNEPLEFSGPQLLQSMVEDYEQQQMHCILTE